MGENGSHGDARTRTRQEARQQTPALFRVLMHNDDYTTMEFVVQVLETIFHKGPTDANRIMLSVHMEGVGVCGTFPYEIAETKVARVHSQARDEGFPLRCSLEEV